MALRFVYQISCNLNKTVTAKTIQHANHFRSMSPCFQHVQGFKKVTPNYYRSQPLLCQSCQKSVNPVTEDPSNSTALFSNYRDKYHEEYEHKPQKVYISNPYSKPRRAKRFPLKDRLTRIASYYKRQAKETPEKTEVSAAVEKCPKMENLPEEETSVPPTLSKLNLHARYKRKKYYLEDSIPREQKINNDTDVYEKLAKRAIKREKKVIPHLQPNNIKPYGSSRTMFFPRAHYTKRTSSKISFKANRKNRFKKFEPTTAPYNFDNEKFIKRKKSLPKMSWNREYSTSAKPDDVAIKSEGFLKRTASFIKNLVQRKSPSVTEVKQEVVADENIEVKETPKSEDWERCDRIISMYKELNPTQQVVKKTYASGSAEERQALQEAMEFVAKCTRNYQLERFGNSKSKESIFTENTIREEKSKTEQPSVSKSSVNLDTPPFVITKRSPPILSYSDVLKHTKPKSKTRVIYPNNNSNKNLYSTSYARNFSTSSLQNSKVLLKIPHRVRGFKTSSKCLKEKKQKDKQNLVPGSDCVKPKPKKGMFGKLADFFRARPDCPTPAEMKMMKLKEDAEKAAAAAGLQVCGDASAPPTCKSKVQPCPLCAQLNKKSSRKRSSKVNSSSNVHFFKDNNPTRDGVTYTFNPNFQEKKPRKKAKSEHLQVEPIDPKTMTFASFGPRLSEASEMSNPAKFLPEPSSWFRKYIKYRDENENETEKNAASESKESYYDDEYQVSNKAKSSYEEEDDYGYHKSRDIIAERFESVDADNIEEEAQEHGRLIPNYASREEEYETEERNERKDDTFSKNKKDSPIINSSEVESVKLKDVIFQDEEDYDFFKSEIEQPRKVFLRKKGPCMCELCINEDFPNFEGNCMCKKCVKKAKSKKYFENESETQPIDFDEYASERSSHYKTSKRNQSDKTHFISSNHWCECSACTRKHTSWNDSHSYYSTWPHQRILKLPTYVCKRRRYPNGNFAHLKFKTDCKAYCDRPEKGEGQDKHGERCAKCGKRKCKCGGGKKCKKCGKKDCKIGKKKKCKHCGKSSCKHGKKKCKKCGKKNCGCGKKKCKVCGKKKCGCKKQCDKPNCDCKKPNCKKCGKKHRKCSCSKKKCSKCGKKKCKCTKCRPKCKKCGMRRCNCKKCACGRKKCKRNVNESTKSEFCEMFPTKIDQIPEKPPKKKPPKGIPMDEARNSNRNPGRKFSTSSMYAAQKKPCAGVLPEKKKKKNPCVTVKSKCPDRDRDGINACQNKYDFEKCKPQSAPFKCFTDCRPPIKPPVLDECRVAKDKKEETKYIVQEMKTERGIRKFRKIFRKYRKEKEKKGTKCYSTYAVPQKINAFHRPKLVKKCD